MRFTVNDASQCAAAGVGTRSSNSIFDSASQTPPPRMHSAIASVGLDFSSDGAGLFPKRAEMTTTRTHFTFRVDIWTRNGESIVAYVAGVEDYQVALATYRAACERWPGTPITLRQGARVIEDSRRLRVAWSDKARQGGR